jgi:hypothetical protein
MSDHGGKRRIQPQENEVGGLIKNPKNNKVKKAHGKNWRQNRKK